MNARKLLIAVATIGLLTVADTRADGIDETTVTFRGWLDSDFRGNDKPDNKSFIDAHHLYFIAKAKLGRSPLNV